MIKTPQFQKQQAGSVLSSSPMDNSIPNIISPKATKKDTAPDNTISMTTFKIHLAAEDAELSQASCATDRATTTTGNICVDATSRIMSDRIDIRAKQASWYKPGISVPSFTEELKHEPEGSFAVLASHTTPGALVILYKHDHAIHARDIETRPAGLSLSKSSRIFKILSDLIAFYCTFSPATLVDLPCVLRSKTEAIRALTPPPVWSTDALRKAKAEHRKSAPDPTFTPNSPLPSLPTNTVVDNHEYAPILPVPRSKLTDNNLSMNSSDSLDQLHEYMGSNHHSSFSSNDPKFGDSNPYLEINVDDRGAQRLKTILKGQQLLHTDPVIDSVARNSPWCFIGQSKDRSLRYLLDKPPGTFVVRGSDEHFASLSLVTTSGLYHAHIENSALGIHLMKSLVCFPSISALVRHYRQPNQADLPIQLAS
jgi:hypothetical protein